VLTTCEVQDNLESQTYETFEKDDIKYVTYEEAVYRALLDRVTDEEAATRVTLLMVVGESCPACRLCPEPSFTRVHSAPAIACSELRQPRGVRSGACRQCDSANPATRIFVSSSVDKHEVFHV
jgi:hypothetical protein